MFRDRATAGECVASYQVSTGEHVLVLQDGFSMSIGSNRFAGDSAVVWLESVRAESRGRVQIDYDAKLYLIGNVSVDQGAGSRVSGLSQWWFEDDGAMVVQFAVGGEVFVTAEKREIIDPRRFELYKKAAAAMKHVPAGPKFVVQPKAMVPKFPVEQPAVEQPQPEKVVAKRPVKQVGPMPYRSGEKAGKTKVEEGEDATAVVEKKFAPEPKEFAAE